WSRSRRGQLSPSLASRSVCAVAAPVTPGVSRVAAVVSAAARGVPVVPLVVRSEAAVPMVPRVPMPISASARMVGARLAMARATALVVVVSRRLPPTLLGVLGLPVRSGGVLGARPMFTVGRGVALRLPWPAAVVPVGVGAAYLLRGRDSHDRGLRR